MQQCHKRQERSVDATKGGGFHTPPPPLPLPIDATGAAVAAAAPAAAVQIALARWPSGRLRPLELGNGPSGAKGKSGITILRAFNCA